MFDGIAKETLIKFLEKNGHKILSSKEDYYVDVVSEKNGYTYFNEAEVKSQWKGEWPSHWSEIRIPERKQRLLDKYKGENGVLNFYVFRGDMKKAWRIKDTFLTKESLAEVKGSNRIKDGELFFHIPYTDAELVTI